MIAPTPASRLADRTRPPGRVAMRQTWADLLFLHWQVDPAAVQRTLPAGLTVDISDDVAWLGVVPFAMRRVRPAWAPALPVVSDFLELNLRTYVHDAAGRSGVWFYSLDCNRRIAVRIARGGFHLPYLDAAIEAATDAEGWREFAAIRAGGEEESRFRYRPAGPAVEAAAESREWFWAERYAFYAQAARSGRLWRGRVAHAPYRLQPVELSCWSDLPLRQAGFDVGGRAPDHACAAEPVEVEAFPLEAVG